MGCGASSSAAPGPRVHPEVGTPTLGEGKESEPRRAEEANASGEKSASSTGSPADSDGNSTHNNNTKINSASGARSPTGSAGSGNVNHSSMSSDTVQRDLALAAEAQRRDREQQQQRASDITAAAASAATDVVSDGTGGAEVSPVALFRAVKKGDVGALRAALDAGVDVNARGMWENTALICACQYAMREAALFLIGTAGCDVNAANEKNCTALHHAAIEGEADIVTGLIVAGASPLVPEAKLYNEKVDKNEVLDPVQAACASGSGAAAAAIVDAVLKSPRAVDEYTEGAIRCIQITLDRGMGEVIEHALRLGRLLSSDAVASTISASCKTEAMASAVLNFAKSDTDSNTSGAGNAVLALAARNGWSDALGTAIGMGALLNGESSDGQEDADLLLVLAVQSGSLPSVKCLLEGGCVRGRETAMEAAQRSEKQDMVDALLMYESGAALGDSASADAEPGEAELNDTEPIGAMPTDGASDAA
jgi:ankyrin repeat protein